MVKKIIFLNVALLFSLSALHADWQDDLANSLGTSQHWDKARVRAIIEKYLNEDNAHIKNLKHRADTAPDGLRGKTSKLLDESCLSSACSDSSEHKSIAKALDELNYNRRDRQKTLTYIHELFEHKESLKTIESEFEALKSELSRADKLSKVKLAAQLAAKEVEFGAARLKVANDKARIKNFLLQTIA